MFFRALNSIDAPLAKNIVKAQPFLSRPLHLTAPHRLSLFPARRTSSTILFPLPFPTLEAAKAHYFLQSFPDRTRSLAHCSRSEAKPLAFSPVVVRSSVAECVKVRKKKASKQEKKKWCPSRNLCPRGKKWPLVATGTSTTCENPRPRRLPSGTVPSVAGKGRNKQIFGGWKLRTEKSTEQTSFSLWASFLHFVSVFEFQAMACWWWLCFHGLLKSVVEGKMLQVYLLVLKFRLQKIIFLKSNFLVV